MKKIKFIRIVISVFMLVGCGEETPNGINAPLASEESK